MHPDVQRAPGRAQRGPAEHIALRIIAYGSQGAGGIGHFKNSAAVLHRLAGDRRTVQQQLYPRGVGIDLHGRPAPFAALPGPAGDRVGAAPGRFCRRDVVIDRLYADHGLIQPAPDRAGPEELARGVAEDVKGAGVRQQPGIGLVEACAVRRVGPGADTGLTQIVPGRPHKVADQIGKLAYHGPVLRQILGEGFAADDNAVRVCLFLQPIAAGGVVVARDVQHVQHGGCDPVGFLPDRALVHPAADGGGDLVEFGAVHPDVAGAGDRVLRSAVLVIEGLAQSAAHQDHQVDPRRDRPGRIQTVQCVNKRLGGLNALVPPRLCDLVADGVHQYGGVVKIPLNHSLQIGSAVIPPAGGIVVGILVGIPHIPALVHDVHAEPVAGVQQCAGAGIVR